MEQSSIHPLAPHHIPGYVAGADGSDFLFTAMAIFGIILVVALGVFYLTLHAIPERMAHKSNHPQLQIVGILALLALFTHNNLFWAAAILVAGFRIPDLLTPIESIADSLAALERASQGMQFLAIGSELKFMMQAAQEAVKAVFPEEVAKDVARY